MRKLSVTKKDNHDGTYTIHIKGHEFTLLHLSKDEEETNFRAQLVKDIIDYYEIGKVNRDLELIDRTKTPQYIFYTILSGRNEHSVQFNKVTKEFSCSCEHGSLHGVNNEDLCKHIKLCQKIESMYELHQEKQE